MATLKAGHTLQISPKNGGSYQFSVEPFTDSRTDNGLQVDSIIFAGEKTASSYSDTFGPFGVDREYSIIKSGAVEVSSVSYDGLKYYEAGELPDPTVFGYGHQVMLTGSFSADTTEILLSVGVVAGAKSWVGDVVSANDAPADPAAVGLPDGVTWSTV